MSENGAERIRFGPFVADLHTHELWKHGVKVKLVGQPFAVLTILLQRPGQLVTREELRDRLWSGGTFVDFEHGLNAAVNRLREALSDSVEAPCYVETLPRRGYRFIAAVKSGADGTVQSGQGPTAVFAATEAKETDRRVGAQVSARELGEPEAKRSSRRRVYLVVAGVLGLLVLTAFFLREIVLFGPRPEKLAAESLEREGKAGRLGATALQRIRPLTTLADETSDPAFSPDGNYVAFERQSSKAEGTGIFVKEVGSQEMVQLTRNTGDCCPVWSPDGKSIAFSRFENKEHGIFVVPTMGTHQIPTEGKGLPVSLSAGSAERKVDTQGVTPENGSLSWSPDGGTIAFSGAVGIYLLSLENSTVRRLTEPPALCKDWGPSFSGDGKKLLFVRSRESGVPEEILSIPATGGETTRITFEHARILGSPQWAMDGQSVIFASDFGSHPGLWRVSAEANEAPAQINDSGWNPAVSRMGYRLAYQRITRSLSVWQLDLPAKTDGIAAQRQKILISSTSETDQGPGPQISPDGMKLAFMSDRSGTMEIWVSNRDGSNPYQLTAVGSAGTPRWSPDSQSVVFDSSGRDGTLIYAMKLGGTTPQLLTQDNFENRVPSWSRDGKWIYFASTRKNGFQVWKVPAEGGEPVQVTKNGGHAALESADGKFLFYAKTAYANPEIWVVPVEGGAEKLFSAQVKPFTWASWAVVDQGIIFAGPSGTGKPVVALYELAKKRVTNLGQMDTVPFWLGASRDAEMVVFDQPGWEQSQIMLVENFR